MKSRLFDSLLRHRTVSLAALAMASVIIPAHATTMLPVVNGGFEDLQNPGVSGQFGGSQGQQVTGWSTTGYNFVFTPGSADTTGGNGESGNLKLYGPHSGGASTNNLPATSPLGGNYIAADGAYETKAITQVITGLTVGEQYTLGFYYAGAQQTGYDGATTEGWIVSLGSETYSTPILNNVDHGFTGWKYDTMTFTATGTQETLSFLAAGTPTGKPPFSLLDGVGFAPAPEPSSFALMFTGLAGVGGFVRNRFKKNNA